MRDFIIDIAVPTVLYFISVAICIGAIVIATAVAVDFISNPTDDGMGGRAMTAHCSKTTLAPTDHAPTCTQTRLWKSYVDARQKFMDHLESMVTAEDHVAGLDLTRALGDDLQGKFEAMVHGGRP